MVVSYGFQVLRSIITLMFYMVVIKEHFRQGRVNVYIDSTLVHTVQPLFILFNEHVDISLLLYKQCWKKQLYFCAYNHVFERKLSGD